MKNGSKIIICHVCSAHEIDDARVYVKEVRSLSKSGYELHLIASGDSERTYWIDNICFHVVEKITNSIRQFQRRHHIADIAAATGAHLYHIHEPALLAPVLKRVKNKAVIFDAHELYSDYIREAVWIPRYLRPLAGVTWDIIERQLIKKCDAVIAATDKVGKHYNALNSNVVVIANYPIVKEIASHLGSYRQKNRCIFTGSISPSRGLKETIKAFHLLRERNVDARLHIAGEGSKEYIDELQQLIAQCSLIGTVIYHGKLPRSEYLQIAGTSGIGMVPHLKVGNNLAAWPVKMFEYMALGLPIVYSNISSQRDLSMGAEIGIEINPERPEEIADAIEVLIKDAERAQRCGENGKNNIVKHFNWESQEHKLNLLYRQLLNDDDRQTHTETQSILNKTV